MPSQWRPIPGGGARVSATDRFVFFIVPGLQLTARSVHVRLGPRWLCVTVFTSFLKFSWVFTSVIVSTTYVTTSPSVWSKMYQLFDLR